KSGSASTNAGGHAPPATMPPIIAARTSGETTHTGHTPAAAKRSLCHIHHGRPATIMSALGPPRRLPRPAANTRTGVPGPSIFLGLQQQLSADGDGHQPRFLAGIAHAQRTMDLLHETIVDPARHQPPEQAGALALAPDESHKRRQGRLAEDLPQHFEV